MDAAQPAPSIVDYLLSNGSLRRIDLQTMEVTFLYEEPYDCGYDLVAMPGGYFVETWRDIGYVYDARSGAVQVPDFADAIPYQTQEIWDLGTFFPPDASRGHLWTYAYDGHAAIAHACHITVEHGIECHTGQAPEGDCSIPPSPSIAEFIRPNFFTVGFVCEEERALEFSFFLTGNGALIGKPSTKPPKLHLGISPCMRPIRLSVIDPRDAHRCMLFFQPVSMLDLGAPTHWVKSDGTYTILGNPSGAILVYRHGESEAVQGFIDLLSPQGERMDGSGDLEFGLTSLTLLNDLLVLGEANGGLHLIDLDEMRQQSLICGTRWAPRKVCQIVYSGPINLLDAPLNAPRD